jgi:hypothetical protein
VDINDRRKKIRHAKECLLWAIQDLPEPLRSMNEREMALLAMDRDISAQESPKKKEGTNEIF